MDPHPKEGPIKSLLSVCLSVQQFSIFLRNGSLVFFWFLAQSWIIKILKNWQSPFFQENSFLPKFRQKGHRMAPKENFADFLKNFVMLVFLGNNIKWKQTLLLIFHYHIWQNSGSWVMGQNAVSRSICGILSTVIGSLQ